jgi:hypothetical protein
VFKYRLNQAGFLFLGKAVVGFGYQIAGDIPIAAKVKQMRFQSDQPAVGKRIPVPPFGVVEQVNLVMRVAVKQAVLDTARENIREIKTFSVE